VCRHSGPWRHPLSSVSRSRIARAGDALESSAHFGDTRLVVRRRGAHTALEPPPKADPPASAEGHPSGEEDFRISVPQISLPKGGGAIRGIGEKFSANPVTGSATMSVPLFASPGRSGFGPQLSLSYDSGAGNGPFGLGWSLSVPAITRKTEKGLPRYEDEDESDVVILAGAEDLVPFLIERAGGSWSRDSSSRIANGRAYRIDRYRPRIEGRFALIERWTADDGETQWRTVTRDNVTTIFGEDDESRIADPAHPLHVFSWLISRSYDDKGNVVVYTYKREDYAGVDLTAAHERNRDHAAPGPQRYLKHVYYGNTTPYLPDLTRSRPVPLPAQGDWMFELVFDYGEHDDDGPTPAEAAHRQWVARSDPFSTYRPGFEVRTHRVCKRVLMFHHFRGEAGVGANCLVRSTNFEYRPAAEGSDPLGSSFSQLRRVWQTGYVRRRPPRTGYLSRVQPPVEFEYSSATIVGSTAELDPEVLENLPVGPTGPGYRWVDLDGEGLSGVLTEQAGAWYYKPNLGLGPRGPTFGPTTLVAEKPSIAALAGGRQQLLDLAGDGELDLVDFTDGHAGFQERTSDGGWRGFVPFASLPNIDWNLPDLRFLDLTGDGLADVLITEDDVFTWYPSLGEDGFAAAEGVRQPWDEEEGPRLVFSDGTQTIFIADMSGDGLHDLVRIRNGEVCYWPSAGGYGRFGAKVTMDNSPRFDHEDHYDPRRVRLADVDGSGPADIFYLARDGARLYVNRSGNVLTDARLLPFPVPAERLTDVQVADLLGNGTACLVWSSALPADAGSPVRYLDLVGGSKPNLLTGVRNNLGAETTIDYAPSTRFYLADKEAGRPWVTRLPFPVHCVERVTVRDRWRNTSFTTRYSYHHGHYDPVERQFCGFGRVEQVDVESFGAFARGDVGSPYITRDKTLLQPPVKTITWIHTGAALDHDGMLAQFRREYFPSSLAALPATFATVSGFAEKASTGTELDATDLSAGEWREAHYACKGTTLRQEVYELDVDALDPLPGLPPRDVPVRLFAAVEHGCKVVRLQPTGQNRFAVFQVLEREALSYHYELDLRPVVLAANPAHAPALEPDPRVAHTLSLSFDELGSVQQSLAVGYRRVRPFADPALAGATALIRGVQHEQHVSYTETRYTDRDSAVDQAGGSTPIQYFRLHVPCEVQTFELTGFTPAAGSPYFAASDFLGFDLSDRYRPPGVLKPVVRNGYHERPLTTQPTMRLVEHTQALFFADDPAHPATFLQKPLALGTLGKLGLAYETYKLALTRSLLEDVLGAKFDAAVRRILDAPAVSGYSARTTRPGAATSDEWWIRSGVAGFAADAARHFYLPERYTDPFGNETTLHYDSRDLFVESSRDALGNTTSVRRFDYRVLTPAKLEDVNANLTEASFDALGRVIAVALEGKGAEADDLGGFDEDVANPSGAELDSIFAASPDLAAARRLLRSASTRFLYHLGGWPGNWATGPAGACTIVRERHAATLSSGERSPLQLAFECSDGNGVVLMKRSQAEPERVHGPLRWIVSGKTVVNNKGKPVKQYEPYFSKTAVCSAEGDAHEEVGVTPLMYYDAVGRLVRTELPDGSLAKVEFSPWHVRSFDANDTVTESRWYADRGSPDPTTALSAGVSPDTRAAWLAAQHAGTPSLAILDSLGRTVVSVAHNRVQAAGGSLTFGGKRYHDERYVTFTKLDPEGKPLWIRDPRANLVVQFVQPRGGTPLSNRLESTDFVPAYDVAGNALFQHSMDAGDRWVLNDAAGKPMLAWDVGQRLDANGALVDEDRLFTTSYDALRRPTAQRLSVDGRAPITLERSEYVDAGQPAPFSSAAAARQRNLCGQLYRHFDPGGLMQTERLDFKGNTLEVRRQLPADPRASMPDWGASPLSALDPETFVQLTEYDALDRVARLYNWHRPASPDRRVAVYEPRYNERGVLVSEQLVVQARRNAAANGRRYDEVPGVTERNDAVVRIEYDAKGQRLSLRLGCGTTTRYDYDPATFRLRQLRTTRPRAGQRDPPFPGFVSNLADSRVLQQLIYTYDAVGNVTEIDDQAYKPVFWAQGIAEPRNLYEYDALYRLVSATGRETAQGGAAALLGSEPQVATGFPVTDQTLRKYTQTYRYDEVGNFAQMRHVVAGDPAAGWTRQYEMHADSNRLHYTWTGSSRVDQIDYFHDMHGNMLNLARVAPSRFIRWDHRDMISTLDLGGGGTAFYQYDADKQRTRKRIENMTGGGYWERIDLGGYELYRRYNGANTAMPVEEIETLHLRDGAYRLVAVDQILRTTRPGLGAGSLYRYMLSNHLGSATLELDEGGRIVSVEEYHPYGSSAYVAGRSAVEAKLKRYRYAGMERDEESGLGYHTARYYAPWLGRWSSVDPLGLSGGINLFSYARGSPVGSVDMSGLQADAATEEKLRKLGIVLGVSFGPGGKISFYRRSEAAQAAPAAKPPRAPRKPAPAAKPAPVAEPPPPEPPPYTDFDPTVPIPKDDEPVITREDIPVLRAGIAPALQEAARFIERAKKGEHIHPAVLEATQKKLGTAGHELQMRGDPALDLAGLSWELARIGGEYWQHRATGLLAAAERGESVSPEEASLVQLQLLKAARQSDDPEVEGALRELGYRLAGIRERALKEKLELAGQGDPWAGRAGLVAQAAQDAERQKQLLGLVGEGQPSELQGLVTELGVKRERVLETELDLALRGELPPEHARGVARRALGIERSKQLLGLVEGEQPSELYTAAETVLRR
jgi:RHS repeat-associated protein